VKPVTMMEALSGGGVVASSNLTLSVRRVPLPTSEMFAVYLNDELISEPFSDWKEAQEYQTALFRVAKTAVESHLV
jgi:hypothetical protein